MQLHIKFLGYVRRVTGKREDTLEVDDGSSLAEVMEALVQGYGSKLKEYVYRSDTQAESIVPVLMLDGKVVRDLKMIPQHGSTLVLLPPTAGGSLTHLRD